MSTPSPVRADDGAERRPLLVTGESLGSAEFRLHHGVKLAYVSGGMYQGIASKEMVIAMGRAGLLSYLGAGGMHHERLESSIRGIQSELRADQAFGVNLLSAPLQPEREANTVELLLRCGVRRVEAAAYTQVTASVARYRLSGLRRMPNGTVQPQNSILAKVSRPEVAEAFMRPAPTAIVSRLLSTRAITEDEALLSEHAPMADDICVEADSAGHTDQGVAFVLLPAMLTLRSRMARVQPHHRRIRVGLAGGIGTPEAAAAAFILGADFVLTGSINQCTVEAGTSDDAKNLLQDMNVQDTDYAPAGDMFELGARVQVLRKGLLFPARANKLYELYTRHDSLDQLDEKTRRQLQEKYFGRSFDEVWSETRAHYATEHPAVIEAAETHPKRKMALIFRWYFAHSTRLAMRGNTDQKVDYQIHCGPALGAFNQWVKGSEIEDWRKRHVADIGRRIMSGAASVLQERMTELGAVGPLGQH
jgi:trans-AT polyketide synthase/acyltransferase/oxidoreductase domain-containing protein